MTTSVMANHTGGSGPLSLMSCVRESSPQESIHDAENDKNVTSKKKFWNPRKWFKRKSQKVVEDVSPNSYENLEPNIKDALRSRSTSELSESDEPISRRRSGTPMHPGLSVSHDSIFHSPNSGSELDLEEAQSSSSLSIQHHLPTQTELRLQTELSERLRLRRGREDVSEDDEGLPRSPCNSPTATEGLLERTAVKNHPSKSHSTCSDGSLLSMGSSEIEEDSFGQQSSRHSSKLSLYEKKTIEQDSEWELGPGSASAPLNHSAAHHKVSVRPKRTHGAPRRKRMQPIAVSALPTTPEVNEDSSARSSTPETASKETITELYSSKNVNTSKTETQLKCSSLPLGLAGPVDENNKLNRSRSSAGIKSQEVCGTLGEETEEYQDDKKADQSIFARLFPRRSAKKKKNKEIVVQTVHSRTLESHHTSYTKFTDKRSYTETKSKSIPRTGPAFRQRVQPIDIPDTLDIPRETETIQLPNESSKQNNSPLQLELEHHFRQRMPPLSTSPSKYPPPNNFETSPKPFKSQVTPSQKETVPNKNRFVISDDSKNKVKSFDESKSKVKIAGLSSLQQRALHQDDGDATFKSLTDFISNESSRFVKKSHSFKSKTTNENYTPPPIMSKSDTVERLASRSDGSDKLIIEEKMESRTIFKASSLDSVKTLDSEEVHKSESGESLDSTQTSLTEYLDSLNPSNSITISGPSHTSVVNISTSVHDVQIVDSVVKQSPTGSVDEDDEKEQQVSITKIEVKRESNESSTEPPNLSKPPILAPKPSSPIEENKPKTVFNFDLTPKNEPSLRKFSLDDIEVVDKETLVETPHRATSTPSTPNVIVTSMTPPTTSRLFKKHFETSQVRKSSLASFPSDSKHRLSLRTKSNSLDIVDSLKRTSETTEGEILKQKVSSTTDLQESLATESVMLRRKSLVKQKQDDEPELMKVFARRSLKLKDGEELVPQCLEGEEPIFDSLDTVVKSKDSSDKENVADSPEERKRTFIIAPEKPKEILVDSKFVETTEVVLRKPINNRLLAFQQKTSSLNVPKVNELNEKVQKTSLVGEKINNNKSWISVQKQEENNKEDIVFKKIAPNDVITNISSKSDYINEDFPVLPKNFNQRKAEWEKRAQEALKKNVP